MATMPSAPAPQQREALSALPSPVARAVAFVAILLGGLAGGLIGWAFVALQTSGDSDVVPAIGAYVGAVAGASGTAVIAVLVPAGHGRVAPARRPPAEHARARDLDGQAQHPEHLGVAQAQHPPGVGRARCATSSCTQLAVLARTWLRWQAQGLRLAVEHGADVDRGVGLQRAREVHRRDLVGRPGVGEVERAGRGRRHGVEHGEAARRGGRGG